MKLSKFDLSPATGASGTDSTKEAGKDQIRSFVDYDRPSLLP